MWQAGWHFTQWQHIARSLLSLSPTCLCRRLFSLFLYLCLSHFLFWSFFLKDFLPLHSVTVFYSLSFLLCSFSSLSELTFLSFHLSFCSFSLFFPSLSLYLNLLWHSSHSGLLMAVLKSWVARLKQHLGNFSVAACTSERMCMYIMEFLVFFIVTYISLVLPQWPILCCSCYDVSKYSNIKNISSPVLLHIQFMKNAEQ